jgi:hypothetical protein
MQAGWPTDAPYLITRGVDELSEQQPAVDGLWVPSMRESWHQSLAAPGVIVIV